MTRSNADRDKLVSELMLDAGVPGDALLKASLESIAGLSALPAPAPRGELAALLGVPSVDPDGGTNPDGDELAGRRRRKHRPAIVAGAVVTAMGLGIGGVAASGGLQQNSPEFIQSLIAGWAPQGNPAPPSLVPAGPVPDAPKVTAVPAPSSLPTAQAAAGTPQSLASPSPSAVPGHASTGNAPSAGKSPAALTEKKAEKPHKVKPKVAAAARKEDRPAGTVRPGPSSPAGSSQMSFRDSVELMLNERGRVGGKAVEDVLRRIVRLGIPF